MRWVLLVVGVLMALSGVVWTLHKHSECRAREAKCEVVSNPIGWEMRLTVDGEFVRSEVCRSLVGYPDVL